MKALSYLIFAIIIILLIPFALMAISDFTGIGKKEGGYKVYKAYSPLKEGQDFVSKNNIKCVGEDVDVLAFVDIGRKRTFFAYNVDYANYYFIERIKYYKVPDEIVEKYKLMPQFTWTEIHGEQIWNWMAGIFIGGAIVFWLIGRKWK